MALTTGSKLGPYQILAPVGAGGMGEVYRALDTRLERTVAIKIIPPHLAEDPDLKQRFDREARTISCFSHAHICQLYDIGQQDGVSYIVMEYLEGETLADRLLKGPLTIDQVLKIGGELADALDKAHRQGIVHRDLKPANVMLTKSGAKLMDFGLAKPAAVAIAAAAGHKATPITPSMPTTPLDSLTAAASPLTEKGSIVGTFQYMAPEVLQGADADARSDIFSLGCVLYEMATGRRAFEGKSQLSVLAAILEKEPEPISRLQPLTPPTLEMVVRSCLAKDPDERMQTAYDLKLQMQWASQPTSATATPMTAQFKWRERLAWTAAALSILLTIVAGVQIWARPANHMIQATILPPDKATFDAMGDFGGPAVVSPDGEMIAFSAKGPDNSKALWVRALNSATAQRMDGTDGGSFPFWSADSRFLGFFSNGRLNKVPVNGGPVTMIANAPQGRGGSWSGDDTILYTPDYNVGLLRVSAQGGTPEPVTKVDPSRHTTHRWPWFLPDGKHFLYFATNHSGGFLDQNGIYFASLDGKENKLVIASDAPGQYASGYLLFHAQTAVMAQRFDPKSGTLTGEAIPVVDRVQYDASVWWTLFSVSTNGVMAYRPGVANTGTQLTWFDRSGKQLGLTGERGQYFDARLSPDGKRIAAAFGTLTPDIWLLDTARQIKARLTFDSIPKFQPAWSPDGQRIAYAGLTSEQMRNLALVRGTMPQNASRDLRDNSDGNIYVIQANGVGKPEAVVAGEPGERLGFPDWSPDGETIFYQASRGPTGHSVYSRPLAGTGKPTQIVAPSDSSANISHFRISPNGRWIAYTSDESGMVQVYVASASGQGGKWQVSVDGADFPAWRGDGKELFFLNPADTLYSADVSENGKEFTIGQLHRLFQQVGAASGVPFDVTGDGKRFLFNVGSQDVSAPLNLVVNWTGQLKKQP